jgi:hypothetical protein
MVVYPDAFTDSAEPAAEVPPPNRPEEAHMPVKDMLDTYPRSFNVDAELLAQTIDSLIDCTNTCSQCADACLSEADVTKLAKCIRLNLTAPTSAW